MATNNTIIRLLKPSGSSTQYCDFSTKDTNLSATISNIENTDIGSLFGLGTNEFVLQDLDIRDMVPSVGLLSGSSFIYPQWMIDANDAQSNMNATNGQVIDNIYSNTGQIVFRSLYNGSTFDNNGNFRRLYGVWDNGNNKSIGKWYFPKDGGAVDYMMIGSDSFSNIQPDTTTGFILSTTVMVPTQSFGGNNFLPVYSVGAPADPQGWGISISSTGEYYWREGPNIYRQISSGRFGLATNITIYWDGSNLRSFVNGEQEFTAGVGSGPFVNGDLYFAYGVINNTDETDTKMYLYNHAKWQINTNGVSTDQRDTWCKQVAYALLNTPYTPVERITADTFFGEMGKFGAVSKTDITKHYPAVVMYKGNELFQGSLYINKIISDLKGNTEYNCILTDTNNSLKKSLEALTIANLNWTDYDHTFTYGNITSSWNTNGLKNGDVIYPHVAYGAPTNDTTAPNYQFTLAAGTNQPFGFDTNIKPLRQIDFKPAIRTKVILDKMFAKVGAQYTSSFLTTAPFTNTFVLPSANANLGPVPDNPTRNTSQVYQASVWDTLSPSLSNSPSYFDITADANLFNATYFNLATDRWTIPDAGFYDVKATVSYYIYNQDNNPLQLAIRVLRNGVEVPNSLIVTTITGQLTPQINYTLPSTFFAAGDIIRIQHALIDATVGSLKSAETITVATLPLYPTAASATFMECSTGQQMNIGYNVNIGQQFNPEDSCWDLLKGLIDAFNLVIEPIPNEARKFRIEPYNTWLAQGEKVDWNDKLDLESKVEIIHPALEQPKRIVFKMIEDSDILNKDAISKNKDKYPYGTYVFEADNDISTSDEKSIGSYFAPTPTTYIPNGASFIIPHLYQVEQSSGAKTPIQFKPRLLYNLGKKAVPQDALGYTFTFAGGTIDRGKYWLLNDSGVAQKQTHWLQVSYQSEFPPNFDTGKPLHYNDIYWTPYYALALGITNPNISTVAKNDLYASYWGGYLNEIYDDEARKMTCNILLDPNEALALRLNSKYFIMGEYWRINKINNVDLTRKNTTTIEFIKIPGITTTYPSRRTTVRDILTSADSAVTSNARIGTINQNGAASYVDAATGLSITDASIVNFVAGKDNLIASSSSATATFRYNNESNPKQVVDFQNSVNIGNNQIQSANAGISIVGESNRISPSSANVNIVGNDNTLQGTTTNISVANSNDNDVAGYSSTLSNITVIAGSDNTIEATLPNSYTPTQNIVAINVSGSKIANINNSNFIGRFQNNRPTLGNLYENNTNIVYGKNVMATTAFAEGMWWNAQPSNIFVDGNGGVTLSTAEYRNKYNFIVGQKQTTGTYTINIFLETISGAISNYPQIGRVFTFTAGANISPCRTINIWSELGDGDVFYPEPIDPNIIQLSEPGQTVHIVALPVNTDSNTQAYKWVVVSRTKAYREASHASYARTAPLTLANSFCNSVDWDQLSTQNNISYDNSVPLDGGRIRMTYPGIYTFDYSATYYVPSPGGTNNTVFSIGLHKNGVPVAYSFVSGFAHSKNHPYTLSKSLLINHSTYDACNESYYQVIIWTNTIDTLTTYEAECQSSCIAQVNVNWENDQYQLGGDENLV